MRPKPRSRSAQGAGRAKSRGTPKTRARQTQPPQSAPRILKWLAIAAAAALVILFAIGLATDESNGPTGPTAWPSPGAFDPATASVRISRSACYGTCPDYSLTIYGNGNATYIGRRFVNTSGVREYAIPPEKFAALVEQFRLADFFSLEDSYTEEVTDLPSTTTVLTLGNDQKRVYNYYGAPERLYALEDAVDDAANVTQWIMGPWQPSPYSGVERWCCEVCVERAAGNPNATCEGLKSLTGGELGGGECEYILRNTPARCAEIITNPQTEYG